MEKGEHVSMLAQMVAIESVERGMEMEDEQARRHMLACDKALHGECLPETNGGDDDDMRVMAAGDVTVYNGTQPPPSKPEPERRRRKRPSAPSQPAPATQPRPVAWWRQAAPWLIAGGMGLAGLAGGQLIGNGEEENPPEVKGYSTITVDSE